MPIGTVRVIRYVWLSLLALLCLCAAIAGTESNLFGFWLVLIVGLPTIWLNREWAIRRKVVITSVFFAIFAGFGLYSVTPAGKRAYAATQQYIQRQKQEAEEKAIQEQAARQKQVSKQVTPKHSTKIVQQVSRHLKMPVVSSSDHLEFPSADAAKALVQRAYPGCAVQFDQNWSGADNDLNVGYDVTKPSGKKVVAYCQFAADPGQAEDARSPSGYYNLEEDPYTSPAQQAALEKANSIDAATSTESQPQLSPSGEAQRIGVYMMAQEFVNDKLKAPGSAKYPDYVDSFVEPLGSNNYQVSAFVDSQNSFGAMLRINWTVLLHDEGNGGWTCKNVALYEQ